MINDIELRLEKCEFIYLMDKYPDIAFNFKDWNGNARKGKKHLYATEGYITSPYNYDPKNIEQFATFLCSNSKFKRIYPYYDIRLTNGPLNSDNYYNLTDFVDYENKMKCICSLCKIYKPVTSEGSILHLREIIANDLGSQKKIPLHTYGPVPWGLDYKGFPIYDPNKYMPNHFTNLKLINKYMFCLALEPMYHELWSWDWITERLFNCFKSKTIAIYYGCYNIEDIIPLNLFIDYRKFYFDNNKLVEYLLSITKDQYMEITENAYNWYRDKCKIGDVEVLENIFSSL